MNGKHRAVLFAVGMAATVGACGHVPLRTFDCVAVLGLRLGQSREEVKSLLGAPVTESGYSLWWDETIPVVDHVFWFTDLQTEHWVPSSRDYFWVEFFKDRLVKATAYRADAPMLQYDDRRGLFLGSVSYGQPTISTNSPAVPVNAIIGPSFERIFQCRLDPELEQARIAFEAQEGRASAP